MFCAILLSYFFIQSMRKMNHKNIVKLKEVIRENGFLVYGIDNS
jgi:acetyl-CoA carboxylase carboxyltransferase component